MPYINIRLGTTLNEAKRDQLYEKTTMLMSDIMRKRREVTVVHIQESDPQTWATNAVALTTEDPVSAYVDIKVTQGTNTPEEKAEMLSHTKKMLHDVVGAVQEACYVVIDDVPANSWGYNGITQAARAASKA
ncbi:MAG: tautomerase family protein [Candidatus Thiodiazotropha sp. (ex Gloverina cf. vestifex)]|nr:tautomerase family protein [Candidatus Thiodiazotropha sp. (ex Gloverina cf. vestifex)]